ncbi:MAG: class I SAM-dependent methyltransferase [Alphaproteobacteria bacterium]|nr:class I SAM-dependent methyltransferase [Alphaproteobacteria bacterium]
MFGPDGPSFVDLVREGLMSTRAGYDHLAPRFDATPFRTPDEVLSRVAAHVASGPRPQRALDACCGTGAAVGHLAPHVGAITGLDFSPGMLAEARRRYEGLTNARFVEDDLLAWTPDEPFDLVTCFGALGHFDHPVLPDFVAAIHRVLVPGGRFVFVTAPVPSPMQPRLWIAHAFNWTMRVRNALISPPFVMYYLTFLLPEALRLLEDAGFDCEVVPLGWDRRPEIVLVDARRR